MAKIDLRNVDNDMELVEEKTCNRVGHRKDARINNDTLNRDKKTVHGATEHSRCKKMVTIAKKRADRRDARKSEIAAVEAAHEEAAEAGA